MSFTTDASEFCDSNVLVYANDQADDFKWQRAVELVERLEREAIGAISIQVLQEFYVVSTRRLRPPLAPDVARRLVEGLLTWRVVSPTGRDVMDAIDSSVRWQVSFWDAMLLVAANKAAASILWSEDLNDGQVYGGVTVRNPFR